MKRIAKHKISGMIAAWSVFFFVLSILTIVAGGIILIAAMDNLYGDKFWHFGLIAIIAGLMIMAGAKIIAGFSVLVRNAEQQSVDSGDDKYFDYILKEEDNREEENHATPD